MKKIIIIAGIAIILVVAVVFIVRKKDKAKATGEISPRIDTIAIEFRLTGMVSPRNRLEIKPQVSGRIEEILVVEGQSVRKGEIIAWMSSTDRAALLDAARAKGEEELKKWKDVYRPTPIIAPLDGSIIVRNKEPGQTVTSNDVILVMAGDLIVEANVDETDLRHIKLRQKVKMFLDAYPDDFFPGFVEHIAYESQIINNVTVYQIKILPLRQPPNFRSGMTATVIVTAERKENVLTIPVNAVVERNGKKFVMVKSKKAKTEFRKIETGITDGRNIEVLSGLSGSETILSTRGGGSGGRVGGQSRFGGIPGITRR